MNSPSHNAHATDTTILESVKKEPSRSSNRAGHGASGTTPGTDIQGKGSMTATTEIRTDNRNTIGFSQIKEKYLPHRYPILMLDRITDYRAGEFIEAIKCVTGNSPELVGHFPDRAILPATYIVQGLAQLGIVFLKLSRGPLREDEMTVVTTVKFKFLRPVFPGDTLKLALTPVRLDDLVGIFNGSAHVDGKSVVRGSLTLAKANVSKFTNPLW